MRLLINEMKNDQYTSTVNISALLCILTARRKKEEQTNTPARGYHFRSEQEERRAWHVIDDDVHTVDTRGWSLKSTILWLWLAASKNGRIRETHAWLDGMSSERKREQGREQHSETEYHQLIRDLAIALNVFFSSTKQIDTFVMRAMRLEMPSED